jgi:hypothetical protein
MVPLTVACRLSPADDTYLSTGWGSLKTEHTPFSGKDVGRGTYFLNNHYRIVEAHVPQDKHI